MTYANEYTLVEKPCIGALTSFGYTYLSPQHNQVARDTLNEVILRDIFITSIQRINQIPEEAARATYQDMLRVTDNEQWTNLLRGNYSRNIPNESTKKTIRLIDFLNPENNTFTVTNQFYVKSQNARRPDIVIFVNGIPIVVIEAKKPFTAKDKTGEAFEQIKQYERDIPRLFYSNAFNIITDGANVLYGATGASSTYWGSWKDDPEGISFNNELEKQLWCLLEPSRLLDILAHFIVFEKREQKVTKKICRYQQFRAVNKIVQRVLAPLQPNPLKEHNLLQAIARTNRVYNSHKEFGLIVDYIGVTKNLTSALATYRAADIKNALVDLEVERNQLKSIHTQLTKFLKTAEISLPTSFGGATEKKGTYQTKRTPDIRASYDILIQNLGNEEKWYTLRRLAKDFIKAYDALSPDPFILDYKDDLKWIAGFLPLATLTFEKRASTLRRDVSAKIREMLSEHLTITGITTLCQLHDINDPEFWQDFSTSDKDLQIAAIRKSAEMLQIMQQKLDENELYYGSFSERVKEVLNQFELRQIEAAETLRKYEQIIRDMQASERAHTNTSLNQKAYGLLKILEAFQNESNNKLEEVAHAIDTLYTSEEAPSGWHLKEQLRKQLRQQVRALMFKLGLSNWKDIPNKVEEYAIKHYVRF